MLASCNVNMCLCSTKNSISSKTKIILANWKRSRNRYIITVLLRCQPFVKELIFSSSGQSGYRVVSLHSYVTRKTLYNLLLITKEENLYIFRVGSNGTMRFFRVPKVEWKRRCSELFACKEPYGCGGHNVRCTITRRTTSQANKFGRPGRGDDALLYAGICVSHAIIIIH